MPDLICTHGDLLESCIDCTVAPPAPKAQGPAAGRFVFYASFEGDCSGPCTMRIEKGQQVAAMTDGTYRHRSCVDQWEAS